MFVVADPIAAALGLGHVFRVSAQATTHSGRCAGLLRCTRFRRFAGFLLGHVEDDLHVMHSW